MDGPAKTSSQTLRVLAKGVRSQRGAGAGRFYPVPAQARSPAPAPGAARTVHPTPQPVTQVRRLLHRLEGGQPALRHRLVEARLGR